MTNIPKFSVTTKIVALFGKTLNKLVKVNILGYYFLYKIYIAHVWVAYIHFFLYFINRHAVYILIKNNKPYSHCILFSFKRKKNEVHACDPIISLLFFFSTIIKLFKKSH